MRRKTRLNRYSERKQKKTIFLSVLGIVVLLFLLFKFGLPALINISLFIAGNKGLTVTADNEILFIPPPSFESAPVATNSARYEIKGTADKDSKVELLQNGKSKGEKETNDKGEFSFNVNLSEGENSFAARQTIKDKKSEFSSPLIIIYKNSPPDLEVTTPKEGTSFKKEDRFVEVTGKTDPDTNVTVNGFYAAINESNGFFYSLGLSDGDNEIKVVAVDLAGNKTEKIIKVNYSP
jgi:hypothetical protein